MMPEKKKTVAVAQVATRAPERLSTKWVSLQNEGDRHFFHNTLTASRDRIVFLIAF
jgi:hypothetical protein